MTRGKPSRIDLDRLRELVRSGATMAQIMAVFRVSKVAVYRACHRHELPLPRTEVYRKAERPAMVPPVLQKPAEPPVDGSKASTWLASLIATGGRYASLAEWAKAQGLTMARAQQEWHRLGLPLRAKEHAAETDPCDTQEIPTRMDMH